MNLALVIGTRPNVIKAAALVPALKAVGIGVRVISTAQHRDPAMLEKIATEVDLKIDRCVSREYWGDPVTNLGDMILSLSSLRHEGFDSIMVVGDCDSTLAGALAAKKLGLKLIHVEAGLRSPDAVQENLNRKLVDHSSDVLFTTERSAEDNLRREGITGTLKFEANPNLHFVGNVMIDTLRKFESAAMARPLPENISVRYALDENPYAVLTIHRAETVDNPERFKGVLKMIAPVTEKMKIIFPVHPRTRECLCGDVYPGIIFLNPLGYLDFVNLIARSKLVLTDSGGVQEETTALRVPCLTLRRSTERPVTVSHGTNCLVGTGAVTVSSCLEYILAGQWRRGASLPELWDGHAAERIAETLAR